MNQDISIVELLLDPDCETPIKLMDDKGKEISFDQIAIIPLGDKLYAILKPITKIEGVEENEALVFAVDVEGDTLTICYDFDIVDKVFDVYYELLQQQQF